MSANATNKQGTKASEDGIVRLSGSLTSTTIESALRDLTSVVHKSGQVIIDCTELDEIDDKGMKFLCSAHRHFMHKGKEVKLVGLSEGLLSNASKDSPKFLPGITCDHSKNKHCIWKYLLR